MKKKHLILLLILIMLVVAALIAFGKDTQAAEAHSKLLKKYGKLNSVSLDFTGNGLNGSMKAKKGNKYILNLGDRIITSNGVKLWNYSITDKNVIVSKYEEVEASSSIENFFFSFLNNYKPSSITAIKEKGKLTGYNLILKPATSEQAIDNVQEVIIFLDKNKASINGVKLESGGSLQSWKFKNLKINPQLKDNIFNFVPPKGIEVIDLEG